MESKVNIEQLTIDDIAEIDTSIKNGEHFELLNYVQDDDEKQIGIWIQNVDEHKACTIMLSLGKKEAMFFGKSLVAMAKSL